MHTKLGGEHRTGFGLIFPFSGKTEPNQLEMTTETEPNRKVNRNRSEPIRLGSVRIKLV